MSKIIPVIMAGGTGSRLWPLSRERHPKQFLALDGDVTMLQATIQRLKGLDTYEPIVITNQEHRFLVAEQLRQLNKLSKNIILEPVGRNTAPAIALAAQLASRDCEPGEDPLLLVLAADHVLADEDAFISAISHAQTHALAGKLVTFGIVATSPETGYGYIRRGKEIEHDAAYIVDEFVEKPNLATAEQYVNSGEYYWNSGMFLFRASQYLQELKLFREDIYNCCQEAMDHLDPDMDFVRIDHTAFVACPSESIDYAVMEHTEHAVVVPLDAGWNDVGSWSSLWDIADKDAAGNVCQGDVMLHQSRNTYIHAENSLVAAVGLDNIVIVQTKDAVLVADKNSVQDVKVIVENLKRLGRSEHIIHRDEYKLWGKQELLEQGSRYKVNRITVRPGGKLSMQMHHHRAEHWIVVCGTALVKKGSDSLLFTENQSVYIPVGEVHSLENPGKIALEMIEVQSGAYLNEDDITRY